MPGKRENALNWEEYFMLCALLARERSKDPSTQVGAVIVKNNRILSVGYNGTPRGMSDEEMPWNSLGEKNGNILEVKNSFVIHAEANALDNLPLGTDLEGATMYVSLSPCPECAKRIAQSKIKRVVYFNKYRKEELFTLTSKILEYAQVELVSSSVTNLSFKLHEIADRVQELEEKRRVESEQVRKIHKIRKDV